MRGMVSPTGAAGVVRVALRAETLECVATLYYTHPTHAARAQAETAEVVTESSSIDVDPNFRKKKIAGLRARTEISLGCYFQRHQSPSASGDPLYFEKVQCPFFKYTFCPSIRRWLPVPRMLSREGLLKLSYLKLICQSLKYIRGFR